MNCLIIGYGSIGARHAFILNELGHSVHIVSKRDVKDFPCYPSIKKALQNTSLDYVVISNETCNHYKSFLELIDYGYSGKILIEKPVFAEIQPAPEVKSGNIFVAYNFRFHPIIQKLRKLLQDKVIYSIYAYAGQYLPNWRSGTDYTKCYSAFREQGGGVLRDLSHELDYINWIAGGWKRVAAIGGKFSDLQVYSDDVFVLLLEMGSCPVASIQINYYDRKARREIIINLQDHSIKADLILNTLEINDKIENFEASRNLTYNLQHKSIMSGHYNDVCTLDQGMDVLRLIHAVEVAAEKQVWVERSDLGKYC